MSHTLTSHPPQIGQSFGWSVAVSDDIAVVGTNFTGPNAPAGIAFQFDVKTGSLIRPLTSLSPQAGGSFGYAVAVSGQTVVVGAPGETSITGGQAGNVYVFDAKTGNHIRTLTSPTTVQGHEGHFGASVAVTNNCVVVGAPGEDAIAAHVSVAKAGNAYVFNASGTWRATLTSQPPQLGGQFGNSVGASGDSPEGPPRVVVGADAENALAGNAYLFDAINGNFIKKLQSPSSMPNGQFGYPVATNGGIVVVGASGETANGQLMAGNAYLFDAKTGSPINPLTRPPPQGGGRFGWSVAVTGDSVAGKDLVVVGAPWESAGGIAMAGKTYAFNPMTGSLLGMEQSPQAQPSGLFGNSVSVTKLLATGSFAMIVGAFSETVAGFPPTASLGKAYIF
jgi:hypothetical protein